MSGPLTLAFLVAALVVVSACRQAATTLEVAVVPPAKSISPGSVARSQVVQRSPGSWLTLVDLPEGDLRDDAPLLDDMASDDTTLYLARQDGSVISVNKRSRARRMLRGAPGGRRFTPHRVFVDEADVFSVEQLLDDPPRIVVTRQPKHGATLVADTTGTADGATWDREAIYIPTFDAGHALLRIPTRPPLGQMTKIGLGTGDVLASATSGTAAYVALLDDP
jgi:hypothetical protein